MKIHNFRDSLETGKAVEEEFKSLVELLRIPYGDVRHSPEHQKLGIDFYIQNLVGDPNTLCSYDVKYDERSYQTGNIAVETVSVMDNDGNIKRQGWVYTSEAQLFVYVQTTRVASVYSFFSKQELLQIVKQGQRKAVYNEGYRSEVVVLPRRLVKVPVFTLLFNQEPDIVKFRKAVLQSQGALNVTV